MKGRWNDSIDTYPKALLAVLILFINSTAVAWTEANCPQAWYKPMLDGTTNDQ